MPQIRQRKLLCKIIHRIWNFRFSSYFKTGAGCWRTCH